MYSIGEFAKINNLSARMLRHYDKIGLIKPEKLGDNKYRYYSDSQIEDLKKIITLKEIGIPLKTIVKIKNNKFKNISSFIEERKSFLIQKMESMSSTVASLHDIDLTKEFVSNSKNALNIEIIKSPEVYGISNAYVLAHPIPTKIRPLIENMKIEINAQNIIPAGYPILLWHNKEFTPEASKLEIFIPINEIERANRKLDEQLLACAIYTKEYDKMLYFYASIFKLINSNNYNFSYPVREISFNYNQNDNLENQLTLIMIPISK
ncbi:MAG TPA: MerR family transcriptional regulator [Spirochaetota bacterium]|nr:MerR family transcriptional regulator [Spirochaetota bacterium]